MQSLKRKSLWGSPSLLSLAAFIFLAIGGHQEIQCQVPTSQYWTLAQQTHDYVVGNLLTPYSSYEIQPGSGTAYAWYTGSQISADAIMVQEGDSRYTSYMNNTYGWMGNLWNSGSPNGGYYAAANVDGSGAGGDQYVDDNSLIGLAYLDAYAVTTGTQQSNYLASAEAIANWLMYSGQWDSTFGGGFWWSTQKTIKPTQSNGLAMQLFLRLYQITGEPYYKSWAQSIDNWLESTMYNSSDGLYNWEIESNGAMQTTQFTYDNAIMIDAFILYDRIIGESSYLSKAQGIANAMNAVLWNSSFHVYEFNTGSATVTPTWSGWASEALVHLYQIDGNTTWLNYAQENINFMNTYLRNTSTYNYYHSCNVDGTNLSTDIEGVDQAWMQKLQAILAEYR